MTSRLLKIAPAIKPARASPIIEKTMIFRRFLEFAISVMLYDTRAALLFHPVRVETVTGVALLVGKNGLQCGCKPDHQAGPGCPQAKDPCCRLFEGNTG